LPQEGTAQGYYLYGGGGILPVAIVFILFYTHLHIHTSTDILYTAGGTGVYLYGGKGMSPLPPACEW